MVKKKIKPTTQERLANIERKNKKRQEVTDAIIRGDRPPKCIAHNTDIIKHAQEILANQICEMDAKEKAEKVKQAKKEG